MFPPYKNSYLQLNSASHGINPRLLNRAVNEAMGWKTNSRDKEPPLNRLTSDQPCLPCEFNNYMCRPQAFGKWAIPKLIRELHSECPQTVSNAIDTMIELLHDPERVIQAIELKIVQRVTDLMCDKDASIRERICIILNMIANQQIGKDAIYQSDIVLKNILIVMKDDNEVVRHKAAILAYTLSESFKGVFTLIDFDYIAYIHARILIEDKLVLVVLLKIMHNLIQGEGKNIAYSIGVFQTLVKMLMRKQTQILEETLNCLMILLTLKSAKKESVDINLLYTLYELLTDSRTEVYTAAAGAIMNATHRTKAKKQSVSIADLLDKLVTLSRNGFNPRAQMWSIRALTNLSEHPLNREYMRNHYLDAIEKIYVDTSAPMSSECIEKYKRKLLNIIHWEP